jgi:O-antigen/teichoic acid export membrane protein
MGVAANAVYAVANKIPSLLSLAQSTFTLAWQENASIVSKDKDAAEYYSKMFSVMLNLYAGFLGLLIACTPILFALLIRGSYEEAYQQMPVLFLGMFFSCMSTFLGGIYIAFKATKSVGISTMLAALCNFVVDLALIRYIGLYAASGSTLISYAFLFAYRMADVRKLVAIRYNAGQMIFTMSFLIVESALCYINSFYTNCVNVVLGTIIFLVLNKSLVKGFFVKGTAFTRKMYNRFIRRK